MANKEEILSDIVLQNTLVLEHIFRFCDIEDLKVCRQVCSLWENASFTVWRSAAQVQLVSEQKTASFTEFCENEDHRFDEIPFLDYFVTHDNFALWKTCGNHITKLVLWWCEFQNVDDLRQVIFKYCPNLTQLRLMELKIVQDKPKVVGPMEPVKPEFGEHRHLKSLQIDCFKRGYPSSSWMDILCHYPSMEALKIRGMSGDDCDQLLKSIRIIRQVHPSKLKLKHLHLFCKVRPFNDAVAAGVFGKFLPVILDSNLALESLSVGPRGDNGAVTLRDILTFHRNTLKTLVLHREGKPLLESDMCIPLPPNETLKNLLELELTSRVFSSLTFLKTTPNLRKLVIGGMGKGNNMRKNIIEDTSYSDMSGVIMTSCWELEIKIAVSNDQLEKLLKWFPNVTKLRMSLNKKQFTLVCEHWTGLVTLEVPTSEVDDEAVTGFCKEEVDRINEHGESSGELPTSVTAANITDLKDLQQLSLRAPIGSTSTVALGYCAARFGFLKMKSIRMITTDKYILQDKFVECMLQEKNWARRTTENGAELKEYKLIKRIF